jgi:predicted RNA-binding protein with PUA-like domain
MAASPTKNRSPKSYWLVKTEPSTYSIDDWENEKDKTTFWDGVRNYQARNTLRDQMKLGDDVLIYHSNAEPPEIVGVAKVVREGYPDFTALDPKHPHYDPDSSTDDPRWFMVDLKLTKRFKKRLSLAQARELSSLQTMELLRKGSRLSVQPVKSTEFDAILEFCS